MEIMIETIGLGAGSYPEAPSLPEEIGHVCEECGWHRNLKEVDGRLLCPDCRAEYYLEHCQREYWEFITQDFAETRRFALKFWFDNLEPEEKTEIALEAFCKEYSYPDRKSVV